MLCRARCRVCSSSWSSIHSSRPRATSGSSRRSSPRPRTASRSRDSSTTTRRPSTTRSSSSSRPLSSPDWRRPSPPSCGRSRPRRSARSRGLTSPPGNLFQQQEANRRRTTWLVIGFVLFFAWLGFGGDWIVAQHTAGAPPAAYHHVFPWLGVVVSVLAAGVAWYAYRTGPEKVLWATGAQEVIAPGNDKERQLVNVVE